MAGFAGLQQQIAASIGQVASPGALGVSLAPNPSNTTTAINITLVSKGVPFGLARAYSVDEQFNYQRIRVIGSAIDVDMIPGVYEATAQIDKLFLYGVTLESALGGGLRAVVGKYQADPDFRKFYFNIVEVDNQGNPLAVRHDCVMTSVRKAVEIDGVVIVESASLLIRWSDVKSA